MSTLFCKWPSNDLISATAYNDECNSEYEAFLTLAGFPEPGAIWYEPREDKNGNWTVALFGPPWEHTLGVPVPEPTSCATLRANAVVVETPEWPEEE